mmetsp:Transcript_1078/g.1796  ORF Transcript_1078/g.1796 Transcript_1078/m.1796 type:complete len:435 (+) Transcript_1078:549-1853(+)
MDDALRSISRQYSSGNGSSQLHPQHLNGSGEQWELLEDRDLQDMVLSLPANLPPLPWTEQADRALESAVLRVGQRGPWAKVAAMVSSKAPSEGRQHGEVDCYRRWFRTVRPRLLERQTTTKELRKRLDGEMQAVALLPSRGLGVLAAPRALRAVCLGGPGQEDGCSGGRRLELEQNPASSGLSAQVLVLDEAVVLKTHKFVPSLPPALAALRPCLGLPDDRTYFWWRAVAAAFMLRPNPDTLLLLERNRDPLLRDSQGRCVAAYVRHGDKAVEMRLVPFSVYGSAALALLPGGGPRLLFLGTEDHRVLQEAALWGRREAVQVRVSNLSVSLLADKLTAINPHTLESRLPPHRQWEYLSYLLHLQEAVSCRLGMVCTVPSNYCRLIDELRTTVGAKANGFFVDLSTETCPKVPCVRRFAQPNFQGQVFDPATRIW